ncbi:myotubularin-related protein 9-like isoform X2 [Gallus gallus]|uniref:myotubularin-related protein 9-like isoform X2 n=1 Tax=Gallus gallus TaxID=9031 RepID=UPI0002C86D0B|nr:myotubularin-related protein 9-like isoform X2 [Gallus gallus]XP_046788030.1 myotubularin-related protein 9-like isoform X2 [Gallus gallus]|eukprot:XP_024998833.1 myotubularin-related protein 9 isoform X2 [Gallus gallus]
MEFSELIKTATVESVLLSCAGQPAVKGTLCITSHHLLLSSCPGGDGQPSAVELWLLIRNVDAVEKRVQNVGWYQPPRSSGSPRDNRLAGSSGTITLRCKDLKVLQLEIPGMEECLNIASSIEALSSVDSVMMMYPFFHRPQSLRLEEGWPLLPVEQYFQQLALQTTQWRLSDVNRDFAVCPTYPPAVIVPAAVSEETLRRAARFRQGGRFPVLSYYHSRNGTVMLRSGQPLTGPNRKRCAEDEMLLGSVLDDGERGFIIDTRSAQAAKQARMTGGGTEPKSSYPQWKRLHRPLERGRPLQESFIKLVEACNDASLGMDRWLGRLESCRWLSHVKAALSTACLAAQCLDREESSVLVHGAEGTDTTLLVTALAQLILEPGCRTLKGFQGLLEREWIQAGHPFHLRCAHSAYSHARLKQEAPLFLLFLDCVWQLSRQFPFSLEFSEGLLLTLFDNAYASDYGTFLCNNEKERCLCKVKESTHSLWAWLDQPEERKKYLNPLYSPNPLVIWPSVEPQSIQLWQGLFFRWIRSSQYLDEAWAEIWRLVEGSNTAVKESTESRLSRSLSDPTAPTENER